MERGRKQASARVLLFFPASLPSLSRLINIYHSQAGPACVQRPVKRIQLFPLGQSPPSQRLLWKNMASVWGAGGTVKGEMETEGEGAAPLRTATLLIVMCVSNIAIGSGPLPGASRWLEGASGFACSRSLPHTGFAWLGKG